MIKTTNLGVGIPVYDVTAPEQITGQCGTTLQPNETYFALVFPHAQMSSQTAGPVPITARIPDGENMESLTGKTDDLIQYEKAVLQEQRRTTNLVDMHQRIVGWMPIQERVSDIAESVWDGNGTRVLGSILDGLIEITDRDYDYDFEDDDGLAKEYGERYFKPENSRVFFTARYFPAVCSAPRYAHPDITMVDAASFLLNVKNMPLPKRFSLPIADEGSRTVWDKIVKHDEIYKGSYRHKFYKSWRAFLLHDSHRLDMQLKKTNNNIDTTLATLQGDCDENKLFP